MGVYPRPRGEAERTRIEWCHHTGLSPPTRGSRPDRPRPHPLVGSIPAHAGKPTSSWSCGSVIGVYPRPRGEASGYDAGSNTYGGLSPPTRGSRSPPESRGSPPGLSPPTRGSRHIGRRRPPPQGSIPAHAGKPTSSWSCGSVIGVYPRPRGEAATWRPRLHRGAGLSPPTRGSHQRHRCAPGPLGSIPAHAGKPES